MADVAAVVFDAYGTLLDLTSAVRRHAVRLGDAWQDVGAAWRTKQIEYTWVRSLAGPAAHRDFRVLTETALRHVAAQRGVADAALIDELMGAYADLAAYPDAAATLATLRAAGLARAILSNGTPEMLVDNIRTAGLAPLLDDVLSVEAAGVFKPDPRTYRLATERFGATPERIAFVSSNPWDAFGAAEFGFRVFWVNRGDAPHEYGLERTATTLRDLAGLADHLL